MSVGSMGRERTPWTEDLPLSTSIPSVSAHVHLVPHPYSPHIFPLDVRHCWKMVDVRVPDEQNVDGASNDDCPASSQNREEDHKGWVEVRHFFGIKGDE